MNERKTENLIRNKLRKLDYFNDSEIIVEEQKSDSKIINNLLSRASKSGGGAGYPEFIIRSKNSDVLIVIECKAIPKLHESSTKDKPKDYAVDGVLHYASFLKSEFHVIAIGASGDEKNNRISTYQWNKGEKRYLFRKFLDLQKYKDYYEIFHAKDKVLLTEEELMQYAKKLHDQMRDEVKLKEAEKPLLVAALLLALDNDDFAREFPTIQNPKKLATRIIESIEESLENSGVKKSKIDTLVGEFAFIKTHTYLNSGEIDHANPSHDNNSLHKFLVDIQNKVYPFVKKVNNIDIIGKFYSEFLRYTGGDGKGLGIVLTPTHITDLFCDLAEVNKNSKVLDICTGTGGFLISAMKKMLEDDPTVAEIDYIYKNSLVGVETQTNMFALAVANMIIRGDGKTNLTQANSFDIPNSELQKYNCNIGLINPPYSQKKEKEKELLFVKKLLDSLVTGGIGVAIIPQSTVMSNKANDDLKKEILKNHSLKAVMSLPSDLFYPTGTVTCVVIFEAHKPHNKNKKTWFGYWKYDGFEKIKHKGRIDAKNKFKNEIRNKWLDLYYNKKEKPGLSILKSVDEKDEWLAEAYLKTNFKEFKDDDFIKSIHNYVSFRFATYNINEISNKKKNDKGIKLQEKKWEYFEYEEIFGYTSRGKRLIADHREKGDVLYFSASEFNNGWTDSISNPLFIENDAIIYTTFGDAYYISGKFTASDEISIFKDKNLNIYNGLFISTVMTKNKYKYSFGRKAFKNKWISDRIPLPVEKNKKIDWKFMEEYIKSLPYSGSLQ
ncbi:MAG: N-6 DNA methylase [bacterium]|nr:N-6 DNA methylase [bacterium]